MTDNPHRRIAELEAEVEALIHDMGRQADCNTALATENERLRKSLGETAFWSFRFAVKAPQMILEPQRQKDVVSLVTAALTRSADLLGRKDRNIILYELRRAMINRTAGGRSEMKFWKDVRNALEAADD